MKRCTYVVAMAGVFLLRGNATAQGISGKWNAMFDADIQIRGDSIVVKSRKPAMLELQQRGDSLFGTWKPSDLEAVAVRGTYDGKVLRLSTTAQERQIRVNGAPTMVKTQTEMSAKVVGDSLAGTLLIKLGEREPPPRKWEAKRR